MKPDCFLYDLHNIFVMTNSTQIYTQVVQEVGELLGPCGVSKLPFRLLQAWKRVRYYLHGKYYLAQYLFCSQGWQSFHLENM
jgi:hypothetical protein